MDLDRNTGHALRARASNPWDAGKTSKTAHLAPARADVKFKRDSGIATRRAAMRARIATPRNEAERVELAKWADFVRLERSK